MTALLTDLSVTPAQWIPRPTDSPRRGNIAVIGSDPESFDDMANAGLIVSSANRRTLFCRDDAHELCLHGISDFDFQFLRPVNDSCGCSCHTASNS